jgi:hypothetical protein
MKTTAVYSETHIKYTNTFCGQDAVFECHSMWHIQLNHCAFIGLFLVEWFMWFLKNFLSVSLHKL